MLSGLGIARRGDGVDAVGAAVGDRAGVPDLGRDGGALGVHRVGEPGRPGSAASRR